MICCGEADHSLSVGGQLTVRQDWQQCSSLAMRALLFKRIVAFWLRSIYLHYCIQMIQFGPSDCWMVTSGDFVPQYIWDFDLVGGPKTIGWPPVWGTQLFLCMGEACIAGVELIHRLSQETSAWLTASFAFPQGVLSNRALLTSYIGRYSCEAVIPQEQKYCQS